MRPMSLGLDAVTNGFPMAITLITWLMAISITHTVTIVTIMAR